ncbi:hypothetical protein O4H26_03470 [Aequorivita viscosa]|nr:hypothetical protein [Aequorivita viscosa]
MKFTYILLFSALAMVSCNNNQKTSENATLNDVVLENDSLQNIDIRHKIANANGFQDWKDVSDMAFTFNVDRGDSHFERAWVWKPKTGNVQMISLKDTLRYNRSKMDSLIKKTDAAFINDKYWLLAPFQLVWDEGISFSEKENVPAPISKDTLNQLTIVYGDEGGYTPGDAYDFFYDKNFKIKEWNYRKANAEKPTMTTTWEDYKNYNGLEIATMHKDSTGNFKLYFTNISVKKETEN